MFDYSARWQQLRLNFSSTDLVSLRVVVNDQVRITQCRNTITMLLNIDVAKPNTITIENLTANTMVNIDSVVLGLLDITAVMYKFTVTTDRASGNTIGQFVSDLGSPDVATISFNADVYQQLLPHFVANDLVPPV